MSKKKHKPHKEDETGAKPASPPKAPKPPQAPEPPKAPENDAEKYLEGEDYLEGDDFPEGDDHPEGKDCDVRVEVDASDFFGPDGPFGKRGVFGPGGPFGNNGPFGPDGLFGPGGIFGDKRKGRHRGGERGPGGPKRRGRMFGPGELRLVLLALIAEEARHGYDCIRAFEEATGGSYAPSPGVVYPTLSMLLDEGLIAERESDDARKVYEATDAGREELERNRDEIEDLLTRIGRKAERAHAARSSDMMRAMGNLASVLTNAASRGRLSSDNKDRIVDLIDELARKIERL